MPYKRKAHYRTLKSGRKIRVKAARSTSPYTGPKIGPLRKGTLSKYGYKAYASDEERRRALNAAVKAYGPLTVFRKLGAVMTLQKRRSPELSAIYRANRNYVGKLAGY